MKGRLYKSKRNKMLGGVCGGISEYFNIDPTIIRLAWVFLAIVTSSAGGAFILVYVIAWIVMPYAPEGDDSENENLPVVADSEQKNKNLAIIIGAGFIFYGGLKLFERIFGKLDISFNPFRLFSYPFFWPIAFVAAGLVIIFVLGRKQS